MDAWAEHGIAHAVQIEGIRSGEESGAIFKELHAETENDVQSLCSQLEHYRHLISKTSTGISLLYEESSSKTQIPQKWW